MFSDPWICDECQLEIAVGMFHGRGYLARFLVCRSCGTVHAIEETADDRLLSMPGPYFREPGSDQLQADEDGNTFVTITWCPFNWTPVDGSSPNDISGIHCTHCDATNLTEEWDDKSNCPSCNAPMHRKFNR